MQRANRTSLFGLLVFTSSFSILLVELAAGRLVARHIGSCLETWTSIIGLLLTGVVLGNLLGGRLADRQGTGKACALFLFLSSWACLAVLPLNNLAGVLARTPMPWLVKVCAVVACVLLPPSFVLGTISPMATGLALKGRDRIGGTMGHLYAWSSVGSILGTYLTGFIFFTYLRIEQVIWIVSGVLLVMSGVAAVFLARRES